MPRWAIAEGDGDGEHTRTLVAKMEYGWAQGEVF